MDRMNELEIVKIRKALRGQREFEYELETKEISFALPQMTFQHL